MTPKEILTKEFLVEEFINKKKSIKMIAVENNINSPNSITQFLKKFGLSRPSNKKIENFIKKEDLENKYLNEHKSLKTIANEYNLQNKLAIKTLLIKYGIPIRKKRVHSEKFLKDCRKKRTGFEEINGRYWYSLVASAKKRNIAFEITVEDAWNIFIKQNRKCALSNLEIHFKNLTAKQTEQTASLDRINSNKGYILENIQWVHKDVNYLKMDFTEERLIELCGLIYNNKRETL